MAWPAWQYRAVTCLGTDGNYVVPDLIELLHHRPSSSQSPRFDRMSLSQERHGFLDEDFEDSTVEIVSPSDRSIIVEWSGTEAPFHHRKTFHVANAAMCLASPVWDKMLAPGGSFKEGKNGHHDTAVNFHDDDPGALHILLNIAHLRFKDIPAELTFEELLQISMLSDKYDMVQLLGPWVSDWVRALKSRAFEVGFEEWLFIAWALGDHEMHDNLSRHLVLTVRMSKDGVCVNQSGQRLGQTMPPQAIGKLISMRSLHQLTGSAEAILHTRSRALTEILNCIKTLLMLYCDPDLTICNIKPGSSNRRCNALILGSFIRDLSCLSLWPVPASADELKMSVLEIAAKLQGIEFPKYDASHSQCPHHPGLRRDIEGILCKIELRIPEQRIQHFKDRGLKWS